jgi:hypothetical protein
MNEAEYRRALLRLAVERLIREDRLARGQDVSHLTFALSSSAAEMAMHALLTHIAQVTRAAMARVK